ncbi:MAG: hypothetical protein ABSC03_09280 [Verrucomicrobiota bacterium]|jgi:hypothetical protein
MKKCLQEIGKGYLAAIGAALLPLTLAAIPQLPKLVSGLSLSDTTVLYIRAGLALFGFALLAFVGWSLFFQARRKLHLIEKQLADALAHPHRFQDDCTLDETGMYRHKAKPGFFCVACAVENRESPMIESSDKGWGWNCPVESKHFVQGPAYKPYTPIAVRSPWHLGPEDF